MEHTVCGNGVFVHLVNSAWCIHRMLILNMISGFTVILDLETRY